MYCSCSFDAFSLHCLCRGSSAGKSWRMQGRAFETGDGAFFVVKIEHHEIFEGVESSDGTAF